MRSCQTIIGNGLPTIKTAHKAHADDELLVKVGADLGLGKLGLICGLESLALCNEEAGHVSSPSLVSLAFPPGFEPWNAYGTSIEKRPIHDNPEHVIVSAKKNIF